MVQLGKPSLLSSLTLLQERKLSASVSHVAICPKMDLLAVVLDRVSVAIYRTNWHKLATIPVASTPDHHVTSLAWSPDGANLAVATSAPALHVYAVDRTAFAATSGAKRSAREAVTPAASVETLAAEPRCIVWKEVGKGRGGSGGYDDRAVMLGGMGQEVGAGFEDSLGGLLFVGDADGVLSIMTANLSFLVARQRVMPAGCSLEGVHLTLEVCHCVCLGYFSSGSDAEDSAGAVSNAGCIIKCVNLKHVSEYWPEIERVGHEMVAMNQYVATLEKVSAIVEDTWVKGAVDVLKTLIVSPLSKTINDFAENTNRSPWAVLQDVFCGARVNGAVLHFLAAELSENGAKEALRAFRSHTDEILDVLHKLVPIAEVNVFRTSEYNALAKLTSRFQPVGLYEEDSRKIVDAASELFYKISGFLCETEEEASQTEAFLAWLVLAAARAGGESIQGRGSPNVGSMEGENARLVLGFFDNVSVQAGDSGLHKQSLVAGMYNRQLLPAINGFRKLCAAASTRPCAANSSSLVVSQGILIDSALPRYVFRTKYSFVNLKAEEKSPLVLVSIVMPEGDVFLVQHEVGTSTWNMSRCKFNVGQESQPLYNSDVRISCARPLSRTKWIYLTSAVTNADAPADVETPVPCKLCLQSLDAPLPTEAVHEGNEGMMTHVKFPDATVSKGRILGSISVLISAKDSHPVLSVDTNRLLAT